MSNPWHFDNQAAQHKMKADITITRHIDGVDYSLMICGLTKLKFLGPLIILTKK